MKKSFIGLGVATIATTVCALRWRPFVVAVSGASMAPTLLDGDACVVLGASAPPRIGDIVVARHPLYPGQELVKRVLRDEGVQGWWLEGDAPDGSLDSRELGAFPTASIVGRVVAIYAPMRRASVLGIA